jgi:HSP20 family molecular chaperone IbpA
MRGDMEIKTIIDLKARFEKALIEYLKGTGKMSEDPERVGYLDPSMDVYIDGNRQLIFLETPGVSEDSITTETEDGTLIVSCEKNLDRPYGRRYLQMERSVGIYFKTVPLEKNRTVKSISHSYKYGVIKIVIEYGAK